MRPAVFQVGGTLYWVIQTRNPDTMVLKDADSTPTVAVRKNGASVADSVTITKRSATTGIYDCSYNPAAEVEGDSFTMEESATVTGTTTSSATYTQTWNARVVAVERGTDSAALAATALSTAVWTSTIAGRIDVAVSSRLAPLVAGRDLAVAATTGAVELDSATSTKIDSILEDTGTTLPAQISGISSGSGSGARTVTITVNDGSTVLQNATVRMTEGVNTYTALTNASGVAVFNLDDATYTVGISKAGYSYAGTTLIVNGTETATYSMTAISVTPGTGSLTTGYLTCLDEDGAAEEGVSVRCQVVQVPASGTGFAYDSAVQLETSDADGLVEFPMIKGARYLVWRGSIKPPTGIVPVLISASAGTTTALGSLIGE